MITASDLFLEKLWEKTGGHFKTENWGERDNCKWCYRSRDVLDFYEYGNPSPVELCTDCILSRLAEDGHHVQESDHE